MIESKRDETVSRLNRSVIRWSARFVALGVGAFGLSLGAGAAMGAQNHPPPVPGCYKTGSGYGTCEGYVIPGGGSIVTLTVSNKKDDFKLSGPAPLQSTKSVACGDLGCVYNHLNWFVGGGRVVSGCGANESTCDVNVPPGSTAWTPVYVRQNNDPPTIWLIWNSGKTGFTLSGKILETDCGCSNKGRPSPVSGVSVTASGAGSGSATTGADGTYSMTLPKGKYTVKAHAGDRPFRPESLPINLTGNQGGADFETCKVIQNTTLQRAGESSAATTTLTFKALSPSTNNYIEVEYTPCGSAGTAKIAWQSRSQCQISSVTGWVTSGYGKKFKPHWLLGGQDRGGVHLVGPPGAVAYAVTANKFEVKIGDGAALEIAFTADHARAAVQVVEDPSLLKSGLANLITPNSDSKMDCKPVTETFELKKSG